MPSRPSPADASSRDSQSDAQVWAGWREEVVRSLDQAIAQSGLPAPLQEAICYGSTIPTASRWRSLLVLQVGEAVGVDHEAAVLAAAAVEALHCATLSVDDLPCMDNAAERRGAPALHRRFNEAVAIQASLWLLGNSRTLLARATTIGPAAADSAGAAATLAVLQQRTENELQLGQFLDMMGILGRMEIDVEHVARLKCGRLFALAAQAPAWLVGRPMSAAETAAALDQFGESIGLAYQVLDDLEDLAEDDAAANWGDAGQTGRPTIVGRFGIEEARRRVDGYFERALAAVRPLAAAGIDTRPLERIAISMLKLTPSAAPD